ncbi:MAG: HAD-IIB family hydrolase [Kiritimatiellae bacterium]|jgi:HAD superfamily hydrolase (TIGR01484 family)|nr:HAD-IIB family hydrolase [Kiritimatiellia bacterium]
MTDCNPETEFTPSVLATDLDGTLIPLPNAPEQSLALKELQVASEDQRFRIVFCTGRHFESVLEAIDEFQLPRPEWIICDVGTSIYHLLQTDYIPYTPYAEHLRTKISDSSNSEINSMLHGLPGLAMQAEDHQQEFKISFECESERTDELVERIAKLLIDFNLPYQAHGSVDPFLDCGLIDLLPTGVSKAYALNWLSTHADFSPDDVIYAGDSGNDYLALTSGFRAIVVANASKGLAAKVKKALNKQKLESRLYLAKEQATSGVLEGCRHFKLVK